jgi:heterodisulfide reductase subunit A2
MSNGGVLIIGAGIAGINAALKLADAGKTVYLCENKPSAGGMLYRLDRWFPDNHCGMCKTLPVADERGTTGICLRKGLFNPRIKLMINTEVKTVEGEKGSFMVQVITRSSGVDPSLCTACGLCEQVCPTEPKAIQCNSSLSINKFWTINKSLCTKCGLCAEKCPAKAIDLKAGDETVNLQVSDIIISTGFEEYDVKQASAFGHGRYPNVLTNLELENLLHEAASGGVLKRPSDGKIPRKVAFLQCIGSRNQTREYCSAVCCMYALKEAIMMKQADPQTDITIFFMDVRDFGKEYHRYYEEARTMYGIQMERCRVPVVNQDFSNHDLLLNHFGDDGAIRTDRFDMVVLSVGQNPPESFRTLCRNLGIKTDKWGYCETGYFSPVESNRPGIYVCGTATGPKDITDTVMESSAAEGLIAPETAHEPDREYLQASNVSKAIVYICNCNHQLSGIIDTEKVKISAAALPGVIKTAEVNELCRPDVLKQAIAECKDDNETALILAGCPRLIERKPANLPVDIIDIRENLSWVHAQEREAATGKVTALIKIAVSKLTGNDIRDQSTDPIIKRTLVIGGGLAGMTAALEIAGKDFPVDLLEKSDRLGGNYDKVHTLIDNNNFPDYVKLLTEKVNSHPLIHVQLNSAVVGSNGYAGNYHVNFKGKDNSLTEKDFGAVIIAAGGEEVKPEEYHYGEAKGIITQTELEKGLANKTIDPQNINYAVMIQCVGSRESGRPYCSRICCVKAIQNALYLKRTNPQINIAIFCRDVMTYGLKEEYYKQARDAEVMFIRYEPENKPAVSVSDSGIKLEALDAESGEFITLNPDLVVLSTGIAPVNSELAGLLDIDLTGDGFVKEADIKFRPVETAKDGIFVCGLAHSPRDIKETIISAQAAAQRAVSMLTAEDTPLRNVSIVNARKCTACEKCVKVCPYHARVIDTDKKVARVISRFCRACGICVAACPNGAAGLNETNSRQILSAIDAAM